MACIIRIHDKKLNGKLVGQLGQSVDPVSWLDGKSGGWIGSWSVRWDVAW